MGASDYRRAPVREYCWRAIRWTPWDAELREAMRSAGHAVYAEMVGEQLIANLRDYGAGT
jgi:Protein of unknown function C-terminus (DUF2399)